MSAKHLLGAIPMLGSLGIAHIGRTLGLWKNLAHLQRVPSPWGQGPGASSPDQGPVRPLLTSGRSLNLSEPHVFICRWRLSWHL